MKTAIETAYDWLETAKITLKAKRYEQSIYSLEMSVEIALKAVLIELGVEVPKVHDIRYVAGSTLRGNSRVPKQFLKDLNGFLSDFDTLLRLRSATGYGFETGFDSPRLEKIARELFSKGERTVEACEESIKFIKKK